MERTEPYPEVTVEESSLVPPPGHKGEWPKKIRTLTAVELDRLTIDGDGRFYWDNKLVNYEGQQRPPTDNDALAILDRAAVELSGQTDSAQLHSDASSVDQHYQPVAVAPAIAHAAPVAMPSLTTTYVGPDKVRIALSPLQSIAAFLVFVGFLAGVFGVAASGFVAAHEWGCKAGIVKSYCPLPPQAPAAKEPPRADIPA